MSRFDRLATGLAAVATLSEVFGSEDFENDPRVANLTEGEGYAVLTPNGDVLPEGGLVFEDLAYAEQYAEELGEGHTVVKVNAREPFLS